MSTVSQTTSRMLPATPGAGGADFGGGSNAAAATLIFVIVTAFAAMSLGGDAQRVLLTASISLLIFASVMIAPSFGFPMVLTYLAFLGSIRRYSAPILGYSSHDPFLLVAPIVAVLIFGTQLQRRNIPYDTPLSKAGIVLLIIMILQIFNPLQGGLMVGLSGAIFNVVPMLWFFAGRIYGTPKVMESFLKSSVGLAVLGVFYWYKQQFFGYTQVEQDWINFSGTIGVLNDKVSRAFSFFNGFSEYIVLVVKAGVIGFAFFLRRNRFFIVPYVLFALAVLFSSSRGSVLYLIAGSGMIWAVLSKDKRVWIPRLAIGVAIGFFGLTTSLKSIDETKLDDTGATLISWQKNGFEDLDQDASVKHHQGQALSGITAGFRNPIGSGIGSTFGAFKFGGHVQGTETDFGDMFVSCGLLGGIAYLFMQIYAPIFAVNHFHRTRSSVALAIFGVIGLGGWLRQGDYSISMFIFFLVGCLDRMDADWRLQKRQEAAVKKEYPVVEEGPYANSATSLSR